MALTTPHQTGLRSTGLSTYGDRRKEAGTYIGPQYDPQVELQGLSVLFKYLLLPSRAHFALGLQSDDEMLSDLFLATVLTSYTSLVSYRNSTYTSARSSLCSNLTVPGISTLLQACIELTSIFFSFFRYWSLSSGRTS
jgi:hypothetical protein